MTMVQNWARVRVPWGLNWLPPVPVTTPISRRMSALTAVFWSATSEKDPGAAEAGSTNRDMARAAVRMAAVSRWNLLMLFTLLMMRCRGGYDPSAVDVLVCFRADDIRPYTRSIEVQGGTARPAVQ